MNYFPSIRYWLSLLFLLSVLLLPAQTYRTASAIVNFTSDAPLELIKAKSSELRGALNLEKKTFGFKLNIISFEGFNNPLQQTHFYENYMETRSFPTATFSGKIIEDLKPNDIGLYRAKGQLKIHGVSNETIIDVWIKMEGDKIIFESDFKVNLSDYRIRLPRIVYQKIAETIQVHVEGQLDPSK